MLIGQGREEIIIFKQNAAMDCSTLGAETKATEKKRRRFVMTVMIITINYIILMSVECRRDYARATVTGCIFNAFTRGFYYAVKNYPHTKHATSARSFNFILVNNNFLFSLFFIQNALQRKIIWLFKTHAGRRPRLNSTFSSPS